MDFPFRLGRLPHNPAQVNALPSLRGHRMAALPPPAVLDRSAVQYTPRMFNNDTQPDCTCAGYANAVLAVGALRGFEPVIDDNQPLRWYAQYLGVPEAPADQLANTSGAVMADLLAWQAQHGFLARPDDVTPYVGLYASVPLSRYVLANTMFRMGVVYLGVTLYERDMENADTVLDALPGQDDGQVVGGHCLLGFDYQSLADDGLTRLATWGGLRKATWRWWARRVEEAYGIVWRQLLRTDGVNDGVDVSQLAGQ